MAVYGAQNTTAADIESHNAHARSFRYLGRVKNHRVVITLAGFMLCQRFPPRFPTTTQITGKKALL